MDRGEFADQRRLVSTINERITNLSDFIQMGGQAEEAGEQVYLPALRHADDCAINSNTKDSGNECDCVVEEVIAKLDAVGSLLDAIIEEREKDVQ